MRSGVQVSSNVFLFLFLVPFEMKASSENLSCRCLSSSYDGPDLAQRKTRVEIFTACEFTLSYIYSIPLQYQEAQLVALVPVRCPL